MNTNAPQPQQPTDRPSSEEGAFNVDATKGLMSHVQTLLLSDAKRDRDETEKARRGLEEEFRKLVRQWKQDTAALSSITHIARHPAYQRIIGMGEKALPLILQELQREPDEWFWALTAITGASPIPTEASGDLAQMAEAWLRWGRERNLI